MVPAQDLKFVSVTPPGAIVDDGSYTTNQIDTLGYEYCTIVCHVGATDIAMAALKVQESDVSGSGFADVVGLDFDGDTDIDSGTAALPAADDDNSFFVFEIDCRSRKRYLDLVATAGDGTTGTYMSATAILSRAKESPVSISERGAASVLRV